MKSLGLFAVLFLCLFLFASCGKGSLEEAKAFFDNNEADLTLVVEYLSSYDYDHILISDAKGAMNLLLYKVVSIEDDAVNEAIKNLFSAGCYSICKDVGQNGVSFSIWSRFMDYGAGIHCALDGEKPPTEQYLTKQKSLGVGRWYYYEEDYNEWRVSQSRDN